MSPRTPSLLPPALRVACALAVAAPHAPLRAAPQASDAAAGQAVPQARASKHTLRVEGGAVELDAACEPLTDSVYGFAQRFRWIAALQPVAKRRRYESAQFRPFLPTKPVAVGDVWRVDAKAVLPFLRQLHAGATETLHHGAGPLAGISAPGTWACLRAVSDTHAEVLLRAHAEFVLQGDGTMGKSSWMTPGQFEGRLWIDRRKREVVAFELALPQRNANVDFNVMSGQGSFSADIGRIPRLELKSPAAVERPARFASERSLGDARLRLRRKFYPFARVSWRTLEDAWKHASARGKPMHVIALFGTLDDESC